MPERITPAKGYKDDKARDEVLKYERRITLDDIRTATKNGLATTADIKAAAKRLGIERRKAARSTGSKQSKKGAKPKAPKRTYGNVPLGKQGRFGSGMESAELHLVPDMKVTVEDSTANIKALKKWYESRKEDLVLRSTISRISFAADKKGDKHILKVSMDYEDPRGFELDYLKDLLTYELGDDFSYRVRVKSGKIVDSDGTLVMVKTKIV